MADTESQNKLNAGLRYVGTSAATLFTMMGALAILSPDQVAQLGAAIHQLNDSILSAYGALTKMWVILGPIAGIYLTKVGIQSSSIKSLAGKLLNIAAGPASPSAVEAQKAIVTATSMIAQDKTIPAADDAKQALIAATIALPEVQTIVTDKATADASPSPSVVAAPTQPKVA